MTGNAGVMRYPMAGCMKYRSGTALKAIPLDGCYVIAVTGTDIYWFWSRKVTGRLK